MEAILIDKGFFDFDFVCVVTFFMIFIYSILLTNYTPVIFETLFFEHQMYFANYIIKGYEMYVYISMQFY